MCVLSRYQENQLSVSKGMEMVDLHRQEEEKAIMDPDMITAELKEECSLRSLINPRCKIPTNLSGRIVYISTSVIGEDAGSCIQRHPGGGMGNGRGPSLALGGRGSVSV